MSDSSFIVCRIVNAIKEEVVDEDNNHGRHVHLDQRTKPALICCRITTEIQEFESLNHLERRVDGGWRRQVEYQC